MIIIIKFKIIYQKKTIPDEINYYGSIWEREADRLGGTERNIPPWPTKYYYRVFSTIFIN